MKLLPIALGIVGLSMTALPANAQIIQAVTPFANPGEPASKIPEAAAAGEKARGVNVLTQASAQAVGSDTTQLGLQAIDLWINRYTRLYGRLTVPLTQKPAVEGATSPGSTETAAKLSDNVIKQLVDPYGGVFNLSGGYFRRLGKPVEAPVAAEAAGPAGAVSEQSPQAELQGRIQGTGNTSVRRSAGRHRQRDSESGRGDAVGTRAVRRHARRLQVHRPAERHGELAYCRRD